jgi:GNAT superfamily N-acetyltransferase
LRDAESTTVVAMINIMYTISTASGVPVAVFGGMVVIADARNADVGSALLLRAVDIARSRGCINRTPSSAQTRTRRRRE